MENKKIPFKYFLPGIAWFFVVGILTLMPASDVPEVSWMDNIPNFDKLVHAGLFGGLAFLFALPLLKSQFSQKQKLNYSIKNQPCCYHLGHYNRISPKILCTQPGF